MTDATDRIADTLEEAVGHPLRRSTDNHTLTDLSITVGKLEESVISTNRNIDKLTRNMEELSKNQFLGKQTNWGMIASWVSVLVLLLGLVVYQPLQEVRNAIISHRADGHPTSVIKQIDAVRTNLTDTAARLQREILLLEQADKDRTAAAAVRLHDLEGAVAGLREVTPEFRTRIEKLQDEVKHLTSEADGNSATITSLKERVLDIEREIYSGAAYRSGRPIKPQNTQ